MGNDGEFGFLANLFVSGMFFLTLKEKLDFRRRALAIADESGTDRAVSWLSSLSSQSVGSDIGRKIRSKWSGGECLKNAERAGNIIGSFGIRSVFYGDEGFPAMMSRTQAEVKDPPFSLFYRGKLDVLGHACVSVVGTRRATAGGRRAAFDFARDACDDGLTVVSGLAFGIDIESHKGALSSVTPHTAAILPGGIDTIVPSSHARYAARILESGGLVASEYLPGIPAEKFRFVERNRIIASLSPATVVIQATAGSGAMITASMALDYNRYVFFHSENFAPQALSLDGAVRNALLRDAKSGARSASSVASKMENSPSAFVESGAVVISSYKEYKNHLYVSNI